MKRPRSTAARREEFIRRERAELWRTEIIWVLRRRGMRRMGLLRVIAEAEMLRLDLRRVVRRPLRPDPRLPDLPRRIRVCRLGITRPVDRELQTVHLLPLPTAEQVPPAVTRPAVRDTPTAAAQVPEAPALALHQLQLRVAIQQAARTIIIQTLAAGPDREVLMRTITMVPVLPVRLCREVQILLLLLRICLSIRLLDRSKTVISDSVSVKNTLPRRIFSRRAALLFSYYVFLSILSYTSKIISP